MVRPLKKRTEDGVYYTRAPKIDSLLSQALSADAATLPVRATITDRNHAQYLPAEALVHLIRHALRMQDHAMANALLPRLGERCAQLLRRRVRDTNSFNAADVREETISSLYELFAKDLQNPDDGVLDYFEVRFNDAFATVRAEIIRKAIKTNAPLLPLEKVVSGDEENDAPFEIADLNPAADVALSAQNAQLYRLIQALPVEERQAILGKYFYDLKTESTDAAEMTVANLCGVSGSEIRSRLRSAYARLKKRMEE